jgi:L,D-peptidoglycan transpeptidase YkuD (ErfK/YbiS/YcfS/YnhG family)
MQGFQPLPSLGQRLHRHGLAALLALLPLTATAAAATSAAEATPSQNARQLVLVITPDWDASEGSLQRFERIDGQWQVAAAPIPITVGRAGSAWGIGLHPAQGDGPQKKEGDGRAPAGVFALGEAFGYADSADTAMPYRAMQASDYCIDVSDSPLYNRIVDSDEVGEAAVAGSTEPMRRDLHADGDQRYRQGLVIRHNPGNIADAGSCIFAHLWKAPGEATAGCTAMEPTAMQALLTWLQPQAQPVFVLLPQAEYLRLQQPWQLPASGGAQP